MTRLRAVMRVQTHLLFCKSHCVHLLAFAVPLQKSPAQQGKLLHPDTISPCQCKVCPDCTRRPRSILRNTFEREHTETRILTKPDETKLHLYAPRENCVPLLRVSFCSIAALHCHPCKSRSLRALQVSHQLEAADQRLSKIYLLGVRLVAGHSRIDELFAE